MPSYNFVSIILETENSASSDNPGEGIVACLPISLQSLGCKMNQLGGIILASIHILATAYTADV